MHINIGQIHANPIAPSRLTEKFVLHSPVKTPTLLVRTQGTAPNVVIAEEDYANPQIQSITSAIQQLGMVVAEHLLPEHQALIDGLCLIFDGMGQIDEILSDESAEPASFAFNNVLPLSQTQFDWTRVPHTAVAPTAVQTIWQRLPMYLGFVLQVRAAYFAGPVDVAMLTRQATEPDEITSQTLAWLWQMFTAVQRD